MTRPQRQVAVFIGLVLLAALMLLAGFWMAWFSS
jgi:membrane protein implicated in regulation of membrane protease activity